jgi:hypothetical protein
MFSHARYCDACVYCLLLGATETLELSPTTPALPEKSVSGIARFSRAILCCAILSPRLALAPRFRNMALSSLARSWSLALAAAAALPIGVTALNNGLGLTPAMGYSSWNDCSSMRDNGPDGWCWNAEDHIKNITRYFIESGLAGRWVGGWVVGGGWRVGA